MSELVTPPAAGEVQGQVPVAPPDDRNPAILDAKKTFVITVVGAALFIASVFVFVL